MHPPPPWDAHLSPSPHPTIRTPIPHCQGCCCGPKLHLSALNEGSFRENMCDFSWGCECLCGTTPRGQRPDYCDEVRYWHGFRSHVRACHCARGLAQPCSIVRHFLQSSRLWQTTRPDEAVTGQSTCMTAVLHLVRTSRAFCRSMAYDGFLWTCTLESIYELKFPHAPVVRIRNGDFQLGPKGKWLHCAHRTGGVPCFGLPAPNLS